MAVLLSGCSGGVDEGAAYRSLLAAMDTRAKHMADSSDAAHRARLAVLDSVLVAYGRAFPGFDERNVAGRYHPADSLAAVAHARRAFNLWALGDTAGTNAAYQAGLPWFYALRDSTQRRDRLRRVAFVAGLVDVSAGVATLDALESSARMHGDDRMARLAVHCKDELYALHPGERIAPIAQTGGDASACEPTDARLLYLAAALLLGLFVVAVEGFYSRAQRRSPYLYGR